MPDAAERLGDEFGLSAAEREQLLPNGRQRIFSNRIHWAKVYLGKAGLIVAPRRGVFTATDDGRGLLARKPQQVDVKLLLSIPSLAEFYKRETPVSLETPAAASAAAAQSLKRRPKNRSTRHSRPSRRLCATI